MTDLQGIQSKIDRVIRILHGHAEDSQYAMPMSLDDLVARSGLPEALVIKISKHLENQGLLEYDHGTVDLTIEGIRKAEAIAPPTLTPPPLSPPPA